MYRIEFRPGKSPLELGVTDSNPSCPDIWINKDGDFIIIGKDITDKVDLNGKDASVGYDEKVVLVPKVLFMSAVEGLNKINEKSTGG